MIANLRCEHAVDPLGVGDSQPRLSWELQDTRRGVRQLAYQILVASSPQALAEGRADLWDSGRVESPATSGIRFGGSACRSRQICFWKVRSWCAAAADTVGAAAPSAWSEAAHWEMGLLDQQEYRGRWISHEPNEPHLNPRPGYHFRKVIRLPGPVHQARVYVTARGVYELRCNGKPVTPDLLRPGWTDYRTRIQVQVYDLTPILVPGENVLGALLGEGWFCGRLGWDPLRNVYGDRPEFYCQIECALADGSTAFVVTDETWKTVKGPIASSGFLLGETYDARLEMPGWDRPGFDDAAWRPAGARPLDGVPFVHATYPPVRRIEEIVPQSVREHAPGVYIFDLGQNITGRVRLHLAGPEGTIITLRYGEMLDPDGSLHTANLRSACSTDSYTFSDRLGPHTWEPSFTTHGFRFVEITGACAPPPLEAVTGIVLHSAVPETGDFTCSHAGISRLFQNIRWSQRGNFVELPTDCPQRDERLGWMGDAQVFAPTACYNMDCASFYEKWGQDIRDAQFPSGAFSHVAPDIMPATPEEAKRLSFGWDNCYHGMAAWGDAGVIMPWILYRYYGDPAVLERSFPSMTAWVDYCRRESQGLISPARGFGDWLSLNADTPKDLLATAYFALAADLVARTAAVLGRTAEATAYQALFLEIGAAFRRTFLQDDGRLQGDTQTGYALALRFGLIPPNRKATVAARLVENIRRHGNHLTTGFVGIGHLLPVLSETGHADLAYELLFTESYPSWLHPVVQGATTIWERWDGWTPERGAHPSGMNSYNHYSLGSVGEWLYASVAGISPDPEIPGFYHLRIHPRPTARLTFAKARYHSIRGPVAAEWRREGGRFILTVAIPANVTATMVLPSPEAGAITESGQPLAQAAGVTNIRRCGDETWCETGSGLYEFITPAGMARP